MPGPLRFRQRRLLPLLLLFFFVLPVGFAVPFTLWFSLALSPLQKQYFPTYMAMAMTDETAHTFPVWWIWKTGPKRKSELADDPDVVFAPSPDRKSLPLTLSPEAQAKGWTGLLRAKQMGSSRNEKAVLQDEFFAGESFARMMITPLCGMALAALLFVGFRGRFGSQSKHEERHGRRTKGPELVSAFEWAGRGKADGIRLRLAGKFGLPGASFKIPRRLESSHILLMGDTGSGKSNAIRQILRQVQKRGESAIVYDPAGEFVQEFYRPERGDYILNPLDVRCPFWNLNGELDSRGIEDALAAAMLPEKQFENGFFTEALRRVLSALLRKGSSVVGLLDWMSDPAEIERRLSGTPQAAYLDRKAGPQRAGVLASLNMIADSLDLLPQGEEAKEWFTTAKWKFERTRWVFLTSKPSMRERILPLHSAWLDLLILRMMEPCVNPAKPVWFVLDELASLNKLPQLHTAVTESRKYGNPVVLGFQGRSQLEKRYGQDAEAMLSQPATKIFFKTSEPRAAKWISETLGEIEVERLKESRSPGLLGSKKNFAMEIATKPLVMASEIAGLEPLRGYIKQENRVVTVRFAYVPKRSLQPEFVERKATFSEPRSLQSVVVPELTVKLDEIVRQRDPELKNVVEQLAGGQVGEAIGGLERQGRVHEVRDQAARVQAIAQEYARSPENTLVVSPDNRSRAEINARIHTELQAKGVVGKEEYRVDTLVPRQDLTGADRTWAARYQFNDVLLYSRTSKETGIQKGEYARVKSVDAPNNLITVVRIDGSEQTYDPRRQQGVSIYREQEKAFSVGDRIQFTAPANELKVANRELGTIQSVTDDGRMALKLDSGRSVSIDPKEHPHLDHGYAVTSHSSQGQTADRVLINIDTDLGAKDLINNRMAYISVSRGAHDAQIFTSDREKLPEALSRDVSHQSAHVPEMAKEHASEIAPRHEHGYGFGISM